MRLEAGQAEMPAPTGVTHDQYRQTTENLS